MNNFYLKNLESDLKKFLSIFLLTMTIGITTGLAYVYYTTNMTISGTEERFNGSPTSLKTEIPEEFPKPLENMILTTHNHIISFSLISFTIGIIFYFNSIISGKIKLFLLIEPFLATIMTFVAMWTMRYIYSSFSLVVMFSAILMYLCWYIMIFISIYELSFKK